MTGWKNSIMFSLIALLSVLMIAGASPAAEKFPSREIIMVVPSAVGSPVDLPARVVAEYLKKVLAVPVVVENRPEAGSAKGIMDVSKANPDGYTLLATIVPAYVIREIVYGYPFKILDFTYLPAFSVQYILVVVNKDSPYKTLKELAEASKKKPLNCGCTSLGTVTNWLAYYLKREVGINMEVVPFKTAALSMPALLGGNMDLITVVDTMALQQAEKIRPLAIVSRQRVARFPGVPTFKELGYDVPFGETLTGILSTPGLREEIRKIYSDALTKVYKDPEFNAKIENLAAFSQYLSGPEFRAETEAMYKFVKQNKDVYWKEK